MSTRTRIGRAAVALILGVLTAACTRTDAGPPTITSVTADGPLGSQPPGARLCTRAGPGNALTLGIDALQNKSTKPITINSVSLQGEDGLTLGEASLMPIVNRTLLGNYPTYPPARAYTIPGWTSRRLIPGAQMQPQEQVNLVAELRLSSQMGTAKYLQVSYQQNNKQYAYRTGTMLVILAMGKRCT